MAVYATTTDLEMYLFGTGEGSLPDGAARLLDRACEEIDYWTRGRIDSDDADHLAAAKSAVCAIVESWIENGEPVAAVSGQVQSYTAGKVSVTYAQGAGASSAGGRALPRRAYMYLQAAGLVGAGVRMI